MCCKPYIQVGFVGLTIHNKTQLLLVVKKTFSLQFIPSLPFAGTQLKIFREVADEDDDEVADEDDDEVEPPKKKVCKTRL